MSDEAGEKKHDPGEKKWRDAAERGQLPRSSDVNAAAVVICATAALVFAPQLLVSSVSQAANQFFDGSGPYELTIQEAQQLLLTVLELIGIGASVPLAAALVASTLASLAQSQMQLAPKALEPRWERLDLVQGFKNAYLSWTPLVELAKGIAKIGVIGLVAGLALRGQIAKLPEVTTFAPDQLLMMLVGLGWGAVLAAAPVMVLVAVIDYAASYKRSLDQLKRTDREIRDDQKEQEGDPRLKGQRRQRARQIAMSVSLNAVREADVVVTNPTHFAVALRYQRGTDLAPVVLAKGVDHLAQRIRREALRAGVPRIENRPLARALHARCDVGAPIPEELFAPVARVLAVVYRRRQRAR
ncbi:MAG TPA: EscU/YscU/HrcU family type III secretion system export apparatus switch protein [Deltaproteobacteria bacterium]|nr:EscU/YscU/HrcU family type III secretion system export apparatus switch protein [Deltaproteobacteria bacterium]